MNGLVAEARISLAAAWLVARGDRSAYSLMNLTEDGFWRSFAAILPVLPLYLYSAGIGARMGGSGASPGVAPTLTAAVLSLIIQWVGWPLIIAALARLLGWGDNFVRYIIAFNWSSVYVIGVMMPPLILYDLGTVSADFASLLGLASLAAALWIRWIVAVTGLGISGAAAMLLVSGELVLSLAVNWGFAV